LSTNGVKTLINSVKNRILAYALEIVHIIVFAMILLFKSRLLYDISRYFLVILFLPLHVFASSPPLTSFDSEQLQHQEHTATMKPERIIETPAIVSRYESKHLSAFGLKSLKDMLAFIPGVLIQDGIAGGGSSVMIRGIVEQYGQRVLFLIDSVPYWAPAHSNIPLLGIPIEAIKHIEVIRGPHTVYFGSNASGGVINVVTKNNTSNTVTVKLGPNGLINGSSYWQYKFNHNKWLTIAAEVQSDDGYSAKLIGVTSFIDMQGNIANEKVTKKEQMQSVLLKYNHNKLNVLAQAFQSQTNHHNVVSSLAVADEVKKFGYLLHANHSWKVSASKITFYSDYNNFYFETQFNNLFQQQDQLAMRFENSGSENYRWRSGINIRFNFTSSFNTFAGVEYEKRATGDFFTYDRITKSRVNKVFSAEQTLEKSFFSQLDYRLNAWRFILGARFTKNEQSSGRTTPQLAITYMLGDNQSFKLLYSQGFSSPNFSQTSLVIPEEINDANKLKAEFIEGFELAYSYQKNNNLFVANAYLIQDKDFLLLYPQQKITRYRNFTSGDRYGWELDFQRDTLNYLFFANYNYGHVHTGEHNITKDEIEWFLPKMAVNIGGLYRVNAHHAIGASLRIIAKRNQAPQLNQLNINYQFIQQTYELNFTIRNALDELLLTPDVVNFIDDQLVTSGDGINFLLEAKLSY